MSKKQIKKQAVNALSRLIDAAKELATIEEELRHQPEKARRRRKREGGTNAE